jgi:hypothetical protein
MTAQQIGGNLSKFTPKTGSRKNKHFCPTRSREGAKKVPSRLRVKILVDPDLAGE